VEYGVFSLVREQSASLGSGSVKGYAVPSRLLCTVGEGIRKKDRRRNKGSRSTRYEVLEHAAASHMALTPHGMPLRSKGLESERMISLQRGRVYLPYCSEGKICCMKYLL